MTIGEMSQHYRTDIHFYGLLIGENDSVWNVTVPGYRTLSESEVPPEENKLGFRLILHSTILNADMTFAGQDTLSAVSDWLIEGKKEIGRRVKELEKEGKLESAKEEAEERKKAHQREQEKMSESWTEL